MRRIAGSVTRVLTRTVVLLVGCAAAARAQRLTGTVDNATTPLPLTSAVVSLLDASGQTVSRTVTDRQGKFILPVSASVRRIRVIHIGFLPQDIALPDSAHTGQASIAVALQPLPQQLEPVRVLEDRCPSDPTMADALALWEQAQSGFLATVVARESERADALILTFAHSTTRKRLTNLTVSARHSVSTRLIAAARSPESFAADGYVDLVPQGWYFNGPDADVLLDPSFRSTHCFALARPDAAHADQVGIAFREAQYRVGVADIRGVLWMDRSPLALRSLDFKYVSLAAASFLNAGGHLTFRTADNGMIVVGDWTLWRSGTDSVDAGAVLLSARWPDGSIPTSVFPTISGSVVDPKTHRPMPAVAVGVKNTNYHATTAADGTFTIDYVFPGQYAVMAFDSSLAAFGVGAVQTTNVTVDAANSPKVELHFPSIVAAAAQVCDGNTLGSGEGVLVARIVDPAGSLVKQQVTIHAHSSGVVNQKDQDGTVIAGRVAFCGVFPATVTITATDNAKRQGTATLTTSGRAVVDTVTITLRRAGGPGTLRR